jgi:choline dehydrogenase
MSASKASFDYIVVGAGTAGCLIAGALARRHRVLLIEAGRHPHHLDGEALSQWPQWLGSSIDYCYSTSSRALPNDVTWNRGRVVGGSGVINGMLYIRGSDADYRNWTNLTRDSAWMPCAVHEIFASLEHRSDLVPPAGKISVQSQDPLTEWSISFYETCLKSGFQPGTADPAIRGGVCYYKVSAFQHQRHSTYASHLKPALVLSNLSLLESTVVEKIIFSGRKAIGVRANGPGGYRQFEAAADIILCCGAVETPNLLLKSGIGPKAELTKLGVSCLVDNTNVGQNLIDHPRVAIRLPAMRSFEPLSAASTGTEVGLFFDVSEQAKHESAPEIQCFILPPTLSAHGQPECAISLTVTHPKSSGSIKITTPQAAPSIDNGYLTVADDLTALTAAVIRLRTLLREHASSLSLAPAWEASFPEHEVLARFIRSSVQTAWHHSCSARMAVTEELGVVNHDYRVFGTDCLRVGDTSAFPDIPTANTNAPAIMFAKRLSDILA